jgi:enediyne biosynthesis protein E4
MKKILKFIALAIPTLILLVFVMLSVKSIMDRQVDYDVSTEGLSIPTFSEVGIDFTQQHNEELTLPFTASAVIDIDNDGVEELFLGGGYNQQDAVFRFEQGSFVNITEQTGLSKNDNDTTYGSVVMDVDNNGYADLIVTRNSGVWLHKNDGGKFTGKRLDAAIKDDTTPLSVAIADINRDGYFDMYVSGYINIELVEGQNIFNKEGYGGTSAMLLNNGDDTFTDITEESGLFYKHNTFQGVFVDLDGDSLEDLVVAHDTGQVRTWKNMGNNTFKNMPNPNSTQSSYPMGIAVGDYNNDGLVDLFFSNVGSTAPNFLVKGDLREDQEFNKKWIMFENKGNFQFEDVADKAKLADYEFSWGAIFEDFNLDGRDDLVVSENYIGCPPHRFPFLRLPGRFMLQNQQGEFAELSKEVGIDNKRYSISPITADFNGDGYPDLIHVNLKDKSRAYINNGGDNQYLKVKLPNTVESIGAMVTVTLADGKTLHRPFILGEGLASDQSHVLIFGLGDGEASEVNVQYLSGAVDSRTGSFANTWLIFQ